MTADRTVVLSDAATSLRGVKVVPVLPSWTPKDPADIANYAADFAALANGQAVRSAQATMTTAGTLALSGPATAAGSVVTVLARGGTDGEVGTLIITATLANGEVLRRGVLLPVVQQAQPPAASPPLLLEGDPAGAPAVGSFLVLE